MRKIPREEIQAEIDRLSGRCGLYAENIETGEVFTVDPDRVVQSASIIKIPMLALLLKDAEDGLVKLDAPQQIAPENRCGGTGILHMLDADYQPSLYVLAKLMIIMSDNTATNHIAGIIGMERFNRFWKEQGFSSFSLQRKMLDWDEIRRGRNNFASAGDTGRLLSLIGRGKLFSAEVGSAAASAPGTGSGKLFSAGLCREIERIMQRQMLNDMLPQKVPAVPCYLPDESFEHIPEGCISIAHKTGNLSHTMHDAGIFEFPDGRKYVLAVMTTELESEYSGAEAIRNISRIMYQAMV